MLFINQKIISFFKSNLKDPDHDFVLRYGTIKDVYPTVDFGTKTDINKAFTVQRNFAAQGPLVSLLETIDKKNLF